jgi:predicted aspartyl protease
VPVEIVGTRGRATVRLIMDTGAQYTFLWRTALPAIGLRKITRVRAAGIAGSKYASVVRVKSMNIGPYRLRDTAVTLMIPGRHNTGYDGLLGMDFLMKVKYEIDYNRSVIIWKGVN